MSRIIFIPLFALAACVGCAPEVSSTGGEEGLSKAEAMAAAVSEERLDKLSEIVRSLRDSDSNMMFPREEDFLVAVKKAYPSQEMQNNVLLDGWGNPFIYRLYGEHRSYRLHSMGPNGTDENGTGDDAPIREGETIIE